QTFDIVILNPSTRVMASLLVNLCIMLSYPINFFIYCGMSRQFRETFKGLFGLGTASAAVGSQSMMTRRSDATFAPTKSCRNSSMNADHPLIDIKRDVTERAESKEL